MKEVLTDKLFNFSNSLMRLCEAVDEKGYSLSLDGTIKRFEFTFEMAWKVLRKFLLYEGIEAGSPRECIKKGYQKGFIDKEDVWIDILKDRNITSHIYEEEEAQKIYQKISELYVDEFKKLEDVLKERLDKIKNEVG